MTTSTQDTPAWNTGEHGPESTLLEADAFAELERGRAAPLRYGYVAGGRRYAAPLGTYAEVLVAPRLCRVPLGPDWLLGVINRRGSIVPVFDLARACGEHTRRADPHTALVLGREDRWLALAIDELPRALADTRESSGAAPPGEPLAEFVRATLHAGAHTWMELDVAGLFRALCARARSAPTAG